MPRYNSHRDHHHHHHRYSNYGSTDHHDEDIPLILNIPNRDTNNTTTNTTTTTTNTNGNDSTTNRDNHADDNNNTNNNNTTMNGNGMEESEDGGGNNENLTTNEEEEGRMEDTVTGLTNRLRCLFVMLTLPILPLGSALALLLLFLLHAAFVSDASHVCSHPLKAFAIVSWVLCVYTPNHSVIKLYLFQYSRDRDGPMRPRAVRIYDQLFHTCCLLYVYSGYTLVNTCRTDLLHNTNNDNDTSSPPILNTCQATCPQLFKVTVLFVGTLQLFTFVLLMPLIFLPCIYLYILRRASNAASLLQQTLQGHHHHRNNDDNDDDDDNQESVTAWDIIHAMDSIRLFQPNPHDTTKIHMHIVQKPNTPTTTTTTNHTTQTTEFCPNSHSNPKEENIRYYDYQDVKDCCICMGEFCITIMDDQDDQEEANNNNNNNEEEEEIIVRTKCGHLFHKSCISRWVGGNWNLEYLTDRRRKAKRKFCPLCREDLTPTAGTAHNQEHLC